MAGVDLTRINSNIAAMNTLNSLRDVNKNLATHQSRLASGKRINEAADDPAGLTLATKFQVRSNSLQQAMDNIGDAKNMLSVAEGGLKKINEIMGKMRVKAEQAASSTLGTDERSAIISDLKQYAAEIDDIVDDTEWNGQKLLNNTNSFEFQTSASDKYFTSWKLDRNHGAGDLGLATKSGTASAEVAPGGEDVVSEVAASAATDGYELKAGKYSVKINIGSSAADNTVKDSTVSLVDEAGNAVALGEDGDGDAVYSIAFAYDSDAGETDVDLKNGVTVTVAGSLAASTAHEATIEYAPANEYSVDIASDSPQDARAYMNTVDKAIGNVSESLSKIGAMMDRLSFKEDTLAVGKVNTEAAFNRIMNADMATEQLNAVKFQILQQTATTMLAQTNQAPQSIMQLFR